MNLSGVLAPLPTPFDSDDRLDLARLRAALPRWINSSLAGVVMLGTTGEFGLLDDDESSRVIETARALVPRDRTFIAGASRESTVATIRAVRRAAELGADAVMVRTPAFFKGRMDDASFIAFYTAVADASPAPVLLYNFTAATGVNLQPSAVARLVDHPNIIGIKESGSDMAQIADLCGLASSSFTVLAGSATTFYNALCAGVTGGILALATLLPDACVQLFDLTRDGRHDEARALQRRLVPAARFISSGHGLPGLKAALRVTGVDVGVPRRPLAPLDAAHLPALHNLLSTFEGIPV